VKWEDESKQLKVENWIERMNMNIEYLNWELIEDESKQFKVENWIERMNIHIEYLNSEFKIWI
jgi:hypothetical protein